MIKSKGELFFVLSIFLGSLYFLYQSLELGEQEIGGQLGPGVWPLIIIILLMILTGSLVVGYFLRRRKEPAAKKKFDIRENKYLLALALMVSYLIFLPLLGFIISTPIFMVAFMFLLGEKSIGWIFGVSLGLTSIIIILFTKAMYVPLPRGTGIFRELSLFFY